MGRQFCYGKEIIFLQGNFNMEKEFLFCEGNSIIYFFLIRRKFFRKKYSIIKRKFYYGTNFIIKRKFNNGKIFPLRKGKSFMQK